MDLDKHTDALEVLDEVGRAVDHGITDWALIDLMPVEVYDALAYALDEIADLREEREADRNVLAAELADLRTCIDTALWETDFLRDAIDHDAELADYVIEDGGLLG